MIENFLLQMVSVFGFIICFGLIVAFSNHLVERFLAGGVVYKASSYIGTPIHELGHAIMCLLFGHKIVNIRLVPSFKSKDGTLGYVTHRYNKRNYYQLVGNFFIAVGPIILGSLVLFLGMLLLLPNCIDVLICSAKDNLLVTDKSIFTSLLGTGKVFGDVIVEMGSSFNKPGLYIYIILGLLLALHFDLSPEDIKGGIPGLIASSVLVFLINIIVYVISPYWCDKMTQGYLIVGAYLLIILVVSLVFCAINILISLILYALYYRHKKVR